MELELEIKGSGVFGGGGSSIMDRDFPPKTPDPRSPEGEIRRWAQPTLRFCGEAAETAAVTAA
jgi:hypothetical protein